MPTIRAGSPIVLRACGPAVDGDTVLVSISDMTSITSKELHEQTGAVLDRVKQGQRFRVTRGGEADALLVPVNEQIDPSWDDIMADVRKARAQGKPLHSNPILAERRKRHYAARLRR
jgi:antitoxin (DNA-binding transcriptional repressor) of toxin-antitoxin stability system